MSDRSGTCILVGKRTEKDFYKEVGMERFFGKESMGTKPAWLALVVMVAILLVPSAAWTAERKIPFPRLKEAAAAANPRATVELGVPSAGDRHHPNYQVIPVIDLPQEPNPYGYDYSEGIAISPRGNIFLVMNVSGDIYKIDRHGTLSLIGDLVANLDDSYPLGLAVDAQETLYVAVVGWNDPAANGVWRIRASGEKELVLPVPAAYWPNAISFDNAGNLYVTDVLQGSVWRLGKDGGSSMWLQDPLLLGDIWGGNGITYRDRSLWVLNTDRGRIVRIPIEHDGFPGQPETFVESPLLVGCDGGQFDVKGNMYVGVNYQGNLARVSPHGDVDILITPEEFNGFTMVTNPIFGFGKDRSTIYITGMNPHVVKVDVGIPGMLLPQFKRKHSDAQ
jgi:sugar lactone lactonase YvrE